MNELKERPDCEGWWEWFEGWKMADKDSEDFDLDESLLPGYGEAILIGSGGTHVVGEDEFLQMTGREPDHDGWTENYWEGTETTQSEMPGLWRLKEEITTPS
jgi:hypothetical protein